jgi:drug/metabolite transporter (DMT)-like permease
MGAIRLNPPSVGVASVVAFLSASLWGLYWIPLRYLDEGGVAGGWAVAALNAPAAVLLFGVVALTWRRQQPYLVQAALIGLFTGLAIALYASSLIYSSVVRATLLFYLTPVWATLIGLVWLGERPRWTRWMAIAAGLAGLALLVSGGDGSSPLTIGDLYGVLSGMCWAIGASLIMQFKDAPVSGQCAVQFAVASILAILLGLPAGVIEPPPVQSLSTLAPIAVVASLAVILPAVCVLFWSQKFLFPGRAGLLMMSEVLTAIISASLLLPEEAMTLVEWLGAGLIIAACLIEVLSSPADPP